MPLESNTGQVRSENDRMSHIFVPQCAVLLIIAYLSWAAGSKHYAPKRL